MEGFSVSGRPAVLWGHPLPSGVVSTRREGATVHPGARVPNKTRLLNQPFANRSESHGASV